MPEVSPSPAEEPDALPESCMLYYDAAETGGATAEGDERPYSPLADGGVSESYSLSVCRTAALKRFSRSPSARA